MLDIDVDVVAAIGERPALKRDGSSAKAIAAYDRRLAALFPRFHAPAKLPRIIKK